MERSAVAEVRPDRGMYATAGWIGPPPSGGVRVYLDLLRSRWLFIVVVVALAIAAAVYVVAHQQKVYAAHSSILVTAVPTSNGDLFGLGLVPQSGDPTRDSETIAQLITTYTVANRVRTELGLHRSPRSLLKDVSALPVAQSSIVTITAKAHDPQLAARLANAFGRSAIAVQTAQLHALLDAIIPRLRRQLDSLSPDQTRTADALETKLQTLEGLRLLPDPTLHIETSATSPTGSVSPRPVITIAAAFVGALLLATAAVLAAHLLDTRIEREDDLQRYRIPVLGRIPREPRRKRVGRHKTLRPDQLSPQAADAYHRLASSLAGRIEQDRAAILVTGAAPRDGKTTTAVSLAAFLATQNDRVLLLEGDARNPSLEQAFGLRVGADLNDVVADRRPLSEALTKSDRLPAGVQIVPSDTSDVDAPVAISPEAAERILREARLLSRWLVVDSPALNYAPDLLALAKRVESVLLVVRLRSTRARDLADLAELLVQQGITPDGFVVIGGKGRYTYHVAYTGRVGRQNKKS